MARNRRYAFAIGRRKGVSSHWAVEWLEPLGVDDATDKRIEEEAGEILAVVWASWHFWGQPLYEYVRDPAFQITGVESVEADDGRSVAVHFRFEPTDKNRYRYTGTLVFDPSMHWALRRLFMQYPGGATKSVTLTYAPAENGFPALARRVVDHRWPTPSHTRVTYTFERYEGKAVPDALFYLSYYGLPEPNFKSEANRRAAWIYLTLGAVCLAAAYVVWRRQARREGPVR